MAETVRGTQQRVLDFFVERAGLLFEQLLERARKQGFGAVVGAVLAIVLTLDAHVR